MVVIFNSCGQKRSGTRKGRIKQIKMEQDELKAKGLRLVDLKAKKIEVHSDENGLIEVGQLKVTKKRYLRDKILRNAYLDLAEYSANEELRISDRDEFRFYPGEISLESKFNLNKALSETSNEKTSWKLQGEMTWEGLVENQEIRNITMALGSRSKEEGSLTYYGTDLLVSRRAQSTNFNSENLERSFSMSFVDLPSSVIQSFADLNSNLFLEVKNFETDKKSMKSFLFDRKKGKTRLVISTPKEEIFYMIPNGNSLRGFLKKIDSGLTYDHLGRIENFLGLNLSEMFNYPDRNTLENITLYGTKKIWWSNIGENIENYKTDGKTIVLAYADLSSLRETRFYWKAVAQELLKENKFLKKENRRIIGKITKQVKSFTFQETIKEIPFEIGRKVCMEDHRFERKGIDCHHIWEAAFSYPKARLRSSLETNFKISELNIDDVSMENQKSPINENGFIELDLLKSNRVLYVNNIKKLESVPGGFVGWSFYDQRLNSYKTRAPYDNLSSYPILIGYEAKYVLEGWIEGFNRLD